MLGTLSYFNVNENSVEEFTFVDQCILNELANIENKTHEYYDSYQFANALSLMVNFLQVDLSGFYLDMAKDILYCDGLNSLRRRQVQTVIPRGVLRGYPRRSRTRAHRRRKCQRH